VALAPLGIKNMGPFGDACTLYGKTKPAFRAPKPGNGEAPSGNGVTVGFAAASPADARCVRCRWPRRGGTCEGAPGARGHLPGAYAAYLRDPAGNKVCSYTFV